MLLHAIRTAEYSVDVAVCIAVCVQLQQLLGATINLYSASHCLNCGLYLQTINPLAPLTVAFSCLPMTSRRRRGQEHPWFKVVATTSGINVGEQSWRCRGCDRGWRLEFGGSTRHRPGKKGDHPAPCNDQRLRAGCCCRTFCRSSEIASR